MTEFGILVIDDDIWMQRILSKILSSFGFVPHVASNGFEGISLAVEHRPILVMLDVLMPDLSGHLTLKVLKAIKVTRDIPVIMVTAVSDIENIGLAVKSGAAGFIGKPFTRATIFDKIREVVHKDILAQATLKGVASEFIEPVRSSTEFPPLVPPPAFTANVAANSVQSFADYYANQIKSSVVPSQSVKKYKEESKANLDAVKDLLLKNRRSEPDQPE